MSVVRIFTPENQLSDIIGGPGDTTAASLVRDAERNVATLRDAIRKDVGERCVNIARLAAEPETEVFAECYAMGADAQAICEIAAAAGLDALGEAARGVHAMIEALKNRGVWHSEALKLHTDALVLLSADTQITKAEADRILKRLHTMRIRVGVPE